ncbi:hypothetical protein CPB86DRAFT_16720 [Serendipita vermifera]|nr:hypothetical protein CPB86DRAFT_16720 [Serendipita vermifera]
MPKNRLLAIFDCFLNPQVVDSHPVTNSVAEALLGALKKHLRPVDPHSSGLAPLKLQKQVLVRRATSITSAIGECLVRLGIQATAPAYAKLPSSVSALLQSIGRALQGMANTDGLVDQSMLHTCVYLACFIADNYVPKEDEEDVAKRLKNILDELEKMPSSQQPGSPTDEEDITKRLKNILEKMPNSQQPGSPTTLSPDDSVRGHLNLLGEQIRGTYSSRSPSNYHSQLPGSTRNQNSTLSPDSTSSGPLPSDTRSNEQHDSIPMIVDTSHSTNEPPVVDPPSTMATGNGYVTLDSDPTASNGTPTALGITFSAS